jgi:hypothetical protein
MEADDEKFSDDPEENLRMENEVLKLKLQAQFGANLSDETSLPLDIENEFLKNVYAFEQNHNNYNPIKIAAFLGSPSFQKVENLDEENLKKEYHRLLELLNTKSMAIDFIKPREDRFKYKFITEELFEHTISSSGMLGMTLHFIYEEFHPDHNLDIRNRSSDFLRDWFRKEFNEFSTELGCQFILANGKTLTREEALVKIKDVFDCYTSFTNCQVAEGEIKFKWNDETQTGIGHAEGGVRFDAILESGETVHFEGPFKLYLSNEDGWWSIFYFVFPGFEW